MYNLYTKFVKILEICKQFSENSSMNLVMFHVVVLFQVFDLEVVALSLTAETESIDSEKWLSDYKLQEYKDSIPNLISWEAVLMTAGRKRQACGGTSKRIAYENGWRREQPFVDLSIEACRLQEENVARWDVPAIFASSSTSASASQNTYYLAISYTLLCGLVSYPFL